MSNEILNSLPHLQPDSGVQLPTRAIGQITSQPTWSYVLITLGGRSASNPQLVPRNGTSSLSTRSNISNVRKIKTLPMMEEENFTDTLNVGLQGGQSYPVLTTVAGTVLGFALGPIGGAGALVGGLLFTTATTGVSLSRTARKVMGRGGDEIWHVEEIGRSRSNAIHVSSFFLVDPFRVGDPQVNSRKAWLIHEDRNVLSLPPAAANGGS